MDRICSSRDSRNPESVSSLPPILRRADVASMLLRIVQTTSNPPWTVSLIPDRAGGAYEWLAMTVLKGSCMRLSHCVEFLDLSLPKVVTASPPFSRGDLQGLGG